MIARKESNTLEHGSLNVSDTPRVPYDTLQVLFARLGSQSLQLGGGMGPTFFHAFEGAEPGFGETVPMGFSTLQEARNSLDYLEHRVNWYFYTLNENVFISMQLEENCDIERRQILQRMENWLAALESFFQNSQNLTPMDVHAIISLRVRYLTDINLLSTTEFYNEMHWDNFTENYSQIVDLASTIIEESAGFYTLNGKSSRTFSLDNGCTAPLFHVARLCRDPVIRRKAIMALQYTHRQEGMWDGPLAARVAQRLVQLEEAGLPQVISCADVPRDARIAELNIQWDLQEKRAIVTYSKKFRSAENPHALMREVVAW